MFLQPFLVLIRVHCACVRAPDASAWFLGLFGSSGRSSGLLPGEPNLVQRFWGLLVRSDLFVGLRQSLTTLCTRVYAFHASVQFSSLSSFPMRDTAPLAGKSGVADEFAAVHESFATFRANTHASDASV